MQKNSIFMVPRRYNLIKTIISCCVTAFFDNVEKLGTDLSFTDSLNHRPHRCAKKASIATAREQSVIVTSQLLATGSCIDDVTIGQHFEPFGAVTG